MRGKKVILSCVVFFTISVIIVSTIISANKRMFTADLNRSFPEKYKIGVISSASVGIGTDIVFLDDDLETVGEVKGLPYSAFALPPDNPVVKDGMLYTSPMGEMTRRDSHVTVAIKLNSGEIKEYDNGKALSCATSTGANTNAIYICNNGNGKSTVARHDLRTDKIISRRFDGAREGIILTLLATDDHVYCSGSCIGTDQAYLYILDPNTLKTQSRVDLPTDPVYMREHEGKIYMSLSADYERSECYIGIIDDVTGEYRKLKVGGYNLLSVEKSGDFLIVADKNEAGKSQIIVYDMENDREASVPFKEEIFQTWMDGEDLYVISTTEADKDILTRMHLESGKLKQIKRKALGDTIMTGFFCVG